MACDTYSLNTAEFLSNVQLDHDVINCQDISCNNAHHRTIDFLYMSIVNALYDAGKFLLPKLVTHKYFPVPRWNEYAKAAHDEAREAFISWKVDNKPRMGPTYELMEVTRARFKPCVADIRGGNKTNNSSVWLDNLLTSEATHPA